MSEKKHSSLKIQCHSCDGTGVLKILNEVVVCQTCCGSGFYLFSYIPFVHRKKLEGVEHVIKHLPGFSLTLPYEVFERTH